MKNVYLSFLFLTFLMSIGNAQNCDPATAQIDLNTNNVNARLRVGGDLWWDGSDGKYIVPQPPSGLPEVSALFAGALWLGGFDSGRNLKLAMQTYGTSGGQTDYWPGYLDENGVAFEEVCSFFDRFWETNSADIDSFLVDWQDNGVLDNDIPPSILAWPARGNPNFFSIHGFELPLTEQGFAPYFDTNDNGIYEPEQGDYPNINGADQGICWVFNDAGNVHMISGATPLQFEVQVLAYAYNGGSTNINNATFYDYRFINRSLESLDSTYAGLWIDPDLGCYTDDYVGCDSTENLAYVYNRDAIDGDANCACLGVNTYCQEIPIVGIKLLKGVQAFENGQVVDRGLSSFFTGNNNPTNGNPPPASTELITSTYASMSGTWADGTPYTLGGNGYNPDSSTITNYLFSSRPDDPEGWSMVSENFPEADRRILLNSGPFDIEPGQVNSMSFAILFVENVDHPIPNIDPLLIAANEAQDLYDQNVVTSTFDLFTAQLEIQLFPNPMNERAILSITGSEAYLTEVQIFSINGQLMQSYNDINAKELEIQRNRLGPGIYVAKVKCNNGATSSLKMLIQ